MANWKHVGWVRVGCKKHAHRFNLECTECSRQPVLELVKHEDGRFEVVDVAELQRLRTFFHTVASLTVDHDVVGEDIASVSPKALGEALEKVDPNWYNQT